VGEVTDSTDEVHVTRGRRRRRPTRTTRPIVRGLERFSGLYLMAILIVVFSFLLPHTFPTLENFQITISSQSVAAILALALVLPLCAGIIDISVASVMGFAVVVVAWLQTHGVNALLAVIITIVIGALIGAVNAWVILKLRVPSFIATLGMYSILPGLAFWLTSGQGVFLSLNPTFEKFGQDKIFRTPVEVFYVIAFALILYYALEFTPLGRQIRAVGGNADAARLSGVRVPQVTLIALVTCSAIGSIGGVVYAANIGSGPLNAGSPYLLAGFAAVFLGSTQIQRGRVNIWGTLVAIYVLAIGVNGLELKYPSDTWVNQVFLGVALIVAVSLSVERRKSVVREELVDTAEDEDSSEKA
jgi:ribose transport system permease protein